MLELGHESDRLHEEVLEDALGRGLGLVAATGGFAAAAERRGRTGAAGLVVGADWEEAYPSLAERLEGDETVLLKASRGVALEAMVPRLEADFGAGDTPEEKA